MAAWPTACPTDRGALGALEALLARFRAPRLPDLPPFHGGIVGWLGYDIVREIERLPNVPADDPGLPDAVMSLTGHVAAFDHFRQRIYLIENVLIRARRRRGRHQPPPTRPPPAGSTPWSTTWPARCPTSRWRRPTDIAEGGELPAFKSVDGRRRLRPGRGGGPGAHPGRRHLPGGAGPAVRLRARLRPVRRLPGAAPGQPVALHVLPPRRRRDHHLRVVAGADGAAARRAGHQPPHRRHPPPGPRRGRRQAPGRRAGRAPQGAGRARDAGRPGPQRRRAGWCASAPSRSTS